MYFINIHKMNSSSMHMDFICDELAFTALFIPYQVVSATEVLLSITSIFTCIYFLKIYIWNSAFHANFKFLISSYFTISIIHAILYSLSYFMLIERVINYESGCDISLSQVEYTILHYSLACCLLSGIFTQVIMVIERVVATCNVNDYENTYQRWHSILYLLIALMMPSLLIFWAYYEGEFNHPVITALSPPSGINNKVNILFIGGFVLSIVALFVLQIINSIAQKQLRRFEFSLSGRYQVGENLETTTFITTILMYNMISSAIYTIAQYMLRNIQFDMATNVIATIKAMFYLHPLFGFLLPIISIRNISKMRMEKAKKAERILSMETKGYEGSNTYNQLLYMQWQEKKN